MIDICNSNSIPIYEKNFTLSEVYEADEAFVTGTFAGIIPIYEIDDHDINILPSDSVVAILQKYYHDLIESESKSVKRIAMWSGPRNISTAMMRSWESRSDTFVIDEPFYPHYLSKTDVDHPGREEIIASGELDEMVVGQKLISETKGTCSIYFQKHITHHLLPSVGREWMKDVINCFLIRNPKDMIISYSKVHSDLNMHLLGLNEQHEIFNYVRKITNKFPRL